MLRDIVAEVVHQKDVHALCKTHFGYDLTRGQEEIVRAVAYLEHPRLIINAMTRYGKTRAVALGICLLILLDDRPLKIRLIGPTDKQASILKTYVAELVAACPKLRDLLDEKTVRAERLDAEISKSRWMFRDGKDLMVISAQGKAERAMGWGGDVIVIDESCLLKHETYRSKISRMLGDSPTSVLIEMSNPWHRENHYYKHWQSARFRRIHVDCARALKEGRITPAFLAEQREDLTTTEFQVLYESVFPDTAENQLISHTWIETAASARIQLPGSARRRYGLDVAEGGGDQCVLTRGRYARVYGRDQWVVEKQWEWSEGDTMQTADKAAALMDAGSEVVVDCIGVGKGVADRLRQKGFIVREFKASNKPRDEKRFKNANAEGYWTLREAHEEERIQIPDDAKLRAQLAQPRKDVDTGKIRVDKNPEGSKSPDRADSLMMLVHGGEQPRKLIVG